MIPTHPSTALLPDSPHWALCRQVDRYSNILAQRGHLNSVIDVLKIDVEGNELPFFSDMFANTPNLLKNVKMIAMELHITSTYTGDIHVLDSRVTCKLFPPSCGFQLFKGGGGVRIPLASASKPKESFTLMCYWFISLSFFVTHTDNSPMTLSQ